MIERNAGLPVPYRERQLDERAINEAVSALTQQIGLAFFNRTLTSKDPMRRICLGNAPGNSRQTVIYPTARNPWSNNRSVAQRVVDACLANGYRAWIVEPRLVGGQWTDLAFAVEVPPGVTLSWA